MWEAGTGLEAIHWDSLFKSITGILPSQHKAGDECAVNHFQMFAALYSCARNAS